MALLTMIFRKIVKNKWLNLCLILGLVISVALISSIPLCTQAILQRMLTKDLETYQTNANKYTGNYQINYFAETDSLRQLAFQLGKTGEDLQKDPKVKKFYQNIYGSFTDIETYSSEKVQESMDLPVLSSMVSYMMEPRRLTSDDPKIRTKIPKGSYIKMTSMNDLDEHIKIIDGRTPAVEPVDGIYEILVSEWTLSKYDLVINQDLILEGSKDLGVSSIKVRPVGVFTVEANNDPYWFSMNPEFIFRDTFVMDQEVLRKNFIDRENSLIYSAQWNFAFDYHKITVAKLDAIVGAHRTIQKKLVDISVKSNISSPFVDVIQLYYDKQAQLNNIMLVLNVPVIIMLFLYIFMISRLIIDRERNEIALLSSRGAKRMQILTAYLVQGLILGICAFLAGPWVGMFFSKILGASNGFLEFVQRKALPVSMSKTVFNYAAIAVGVSVLTMLLPAYFASKTSIVNYKRNASAKPKPAIWEKMMLDVIFLAIAGYGFYIFNQHQKNMKLSEASALDVQLDPLLFVVPTLFILGMGLLFLRIYPWLVRGVYWLGRRIWSPSIYVTLTQVGRMFKSYHFLVIFMIMTLSTGIFSATSARTINRNEEEKIKYSVGSDMVLEALWDSDAKPASPFPSAPSEGDSEPTTEEGGRVNYVEPPFEPYTKLDGVEYAAKVFTRENASLQNRGNYVGNVELMGIDSYEFGNVAWFRGGLLPHNFNEYLNILAAEPSACLISKSISEEYDIHPGDYIQMGWRTGEDTAIFNVYGVVDYWPSWNPNKRPMPANSPEPRLVVANLPYIQDHLGLEPYNVWLKLKPDATSQQVYNSIQKNDMIITNITDARQMLIKAMKSPMQMAINGVLTLGFMVSGVICFMGFLIYWILSINSRVLQFGIYRAMGLSVRKLISMITWEHILTSGAAIVSGIFIGLVASKIFVPFFEMTYEIYSQVPPFKVISYTDDRTKIYLLVGFTLLIGLGILAFRIKRIKIHQAIKLGEE